MFNVINVSFPLQSFIICHRPGCRVRGMKKKNVFTRGSAAQFFLYAYRDVNYKKWGGGVTYPKDSLTLISTMEGV